MKLKRFSGLLFQFITASFIGWLYEIITIYIMYDTYYDRGVLHLPLCPIYGFGMLMLYAVLRKIKNGVLYFSGSVIITTLLELSVSYIAEYRFGLILWSYDDWPLNFQGRISLISSCIFGFLAVGFVKLIKPKIDSIFEKYPLKYTAGLTLSLAGGFTIWELLNLFYNK
ncbi:MAG: ABC transporter permease [Ruminococcus sp.]|nr:ABC transporter permease [Ruminococcus sp.]